MKKVDKLPHIEDLLLENTGQHVAWLLSNVINAIQLKGSHNLTIKYDGSPSILAGIDPEDGRFFVATKSIFNKTPVLYKSYSEMDSIENSGLKAVLQSAFEYLSPLLFPCIWQGDVMWTEKDSLLKCKEVGSGESLVLFGTNTLVYEASTDAAHIYNSKFGIAWHTPYEGSSIKDLQVCNEHHKVTKPCSLSSSVPFDVIDLDTHPDFSKIPVLDSLMILSLMSQLRYIRSSAPNFVLDELVKPLLKKFLAINQTSKPLLMDEFIENLLIFVQEDFRIKEGSRKSIDGKHSVRRERNNVISWITMNSYDLWFLSRAYAITVNVKSILLDILEPTAPYKAVFSDGTLTNQEGFVLKVGENIVKLVDRNVFTVANKSSVYEKAK